MSTTGQNVWDPGYERKATLLLALGFGLVGLDRWIIAPVFPAMMSDLHLGYQDLGNMVGVLAVGWGMSAIFMGRAADRIGRRPIVTAAILAFSLISASTGFCVGVMSLLVVRFLTGVAEGAYTPACTAATFDAARPDRRGRAIGIIFAAFPLLGLGAGPIVATQLLRVMPSWRWVFFLAALPGLVLALLLFRVIRDVRAAPKESTILPWIMILRSRNALLASVAMIGAMSCAFVIGAMMPSFLIDGLQLTTLSMGIVMSSVGIGGAIGNFIVPAASDILGRKLAALTAGVLAVAALLLLGTLGPSIPALYAVLLILSIFSFGLISVMSGPIATESVPVAVAASAIGLITGCAEIFGGGIAPIIAGAVASHFGIHHVLDVGVAGLALALTAVVLMRETLPAATHSVQ